MHMNFILTVYLLGVGAELGFIWRFVVLGYLEQLLSKIAQKPKYFFVEAATTRVGTMKKLIRTWLTEIKKCNWLVTVV